MTMNNILNIINFVRASEPRAEDDSFLLKTFRREVDMCREFNFPATFLFQYDALILPDIDAGNILGKCLIVTAKAEMGGVIMGAKVPIVLTSRGSSAEEKFFSIAVASLMAGQTL